MTTSDRRRTGTAKITHALDLIRAGTPIEKAAQQVGITWRTLRPHVPEHLVRPRGGCHTPTDPTKLAAALALVEDGASITEAARTLHISWKVLARTTDKRWTPQEAGSLGRAVRIHNQRSNR